jgi:hypothetical protein
MLAMNSSCCGYNLPHRPAKVWLVEHADILPLFVLASVTTVVLHMLEQLAGLCCDRWTGIMIGKWTAGIQRSSSDTCPYYACSHSF